MSLCMRTCSSANKRRCKTTNNVCLFHTNSNVRTISARAYNLKIIVCKIVQNTFVCVAKQSTISVTLSPIFCVLPFTNISTLSFYYEIDSIWKLQYRVFSCTILNFSHTITIRLKMIQTSHHNLLSLSLVHAAIEYISPPPHSSLPFFQSVIKTQSLL